MKPIAVSLLSLLFSQKAWAVCPVCTIAIVGGLGVLEWLGVDDVIGGIWIGALTVCLIFWTQSWLDKKGWRAWWARLLNVAVYYALTLSVYFFPEVRFGANTLWGFDKLALGILIGSAALLASHLSYQLVKAKNGGHPWFPFQKVVQHVAVVALLSVVFYYIVEGLVHVV